MPRPLNTELGGTGRNDGQFNFTAPGVGTVVRGSNDKLAEVISLQDFGASTSASASENSVAVTAAMAWMSANNGRVLVNGLYTIDGDMPVLANGFHFFGHDKFNDGFIFAPQSSSITGGVHAYFLPDSATNTSRMIFENMCLKSTYDSGTWSGSTVFAGLQCAPNNGITHSNIQFIDCYFKDPSFTMAYMVPHLGGIVRNVFIINCVADVTNLATSSRIANILQCIIEGIGYSGHATTYGLQQIFDIQVRGGYGRGWRTYADLKRGSARFVVDGVVTEDMSDCHHSCDGAFYGTFCNVIGTQATASATIPSKCFIDLGGEDITVTNWKYNGATGLGTVAAILAEAYAYPSESSTAFHQPKRLLIKDGSATGVNQNAIRLQDTIDSRVDGFFVADITQAAVSFEHPATTTNGGANAAIPTRNSADNIMGGVSVGVYGVNNATTAIQSRVGNIDGFAGKVTGNLTYDPIYPDNENPNRQMLLDSAGVLTGWGLSASCTVSQSSNAPVWAAQSVLINGSSAVVLEQVGLNNRPRVLLGDVVSFRASTLWGTATATGVLFQEYDSAGGFLSNDFQDVPANAATWTENILYHTVSDASCTNVKVWILPNTNFNSVGATGTSYWADVVVTKKTA